MPKGIKAADRSYASDLFTEVINSPRVKDEVARRLGIERNRVNQKAIGKVLGIDQSRVSKIAQDGRTSLEAVVKAAELVGRPQEEIDRLLGRRARGRPAAVDVGDPPIGTFLLQFKATPGLEAWCNLNPTAVRVSQVLRGIDAYAKNPPLSLDAHGGPIGGWGAYFEALEAGELGQPSASKGTPEAVLDLERRAHPQLFPTDGGRPKGKKPRTRK
jgi:predicted XRE-type DNA-binding protein